MLGLVVFLALCFAAAGLGWFWSDAGLAEWYPKLRKPGWTPSTRVFGLVWAVLYLTMAAAGWLIWRRRGLPGSRLALVLFAVQLGLNAVWTGLFFTLRNPGLAFGEISLLWLAIVGALMAFWRISRIAAILMTPYLLWVSFVAILNLLIWMMNA